MNDLLTPKEIAIKLYKKHNIWFTGKHFTGNPKVLINGNEKEIGDIVFQFKEGNIIIKVYLYNKDEILQVANEAVASYGKLIREWNMEKANEG